MENSFSVTFYPKRSDIDKQGKVPLYLRIRLAENRSESSIHRRIVPEHWNASGGKAKGLNSDLRELNRYMDGIRSNVYKIHGRLVEKDIPFSVQDIKDIYIGKEQKPKMLLEVFQEHNDQMERLVGKEFSAGTAQRYSTPQKLISPANVLGEKFINLEENLKIQIAENQLLTKTLVRSYI